MKPAFAETLKLLLNIEMDIHTQSELLLSVRLLVSEDQCDNRFVFIRQVLKPSTLAGKDMKLQYKTTEEQEVLSYYGVQWDAAQGTVLQKKSLEKYRAAKALKFLTGRTQSGLEYIDHMSILLKCNKKHH
ncbi:hypothetical protein HHK36_006875 [Tetracentron sinense]|uniref:Uncharacterized protein n=1 Tax=Tetracentron sinense TaxID=13715 RepID=A0A834ZLQ3_TETSI|nr:hypothetical protein HHK36_006875 [Tetracentron sinense]